MILSNVAVVAGTPVAVTLPGDVTSPCSVIIGNGGPNKAYMVNAGATSEADPSMSLGVNGVITATGIGGETIWFICHAAETATLTVAKTEV